MSLCASSEAHCPVHYYQVLSDLEKFQDLVKEVAVCACRNYLSEPQSKSDSPSAYTLTIWRHWNVHT